MSTASEVQPTEVWIHMRQDKSLEKLSCSVPSIEIKLKFHMTWSGSSLWHLRLYVAITDAYHHIMNDVSSSYRIKCCSKTVVLGWKGEFVGTVVSSLQRVAGKQCHWIHYQWSVGKTDNIFLGPEYQPGSLVYSANNILVSLVLNHLAQTASMLIGTLCYLQINNSIQIFCLPWCMTGNLKSKTESSLMNLELKHSLICTWMSAMSDSSLDK